MPAWAYLEVPSDLNFSITEVRNFLLEGDHPDSTGLAPTSMPAGSSVVTSSSQLAPLSIMPSDAVSWSSLATLQAPASITASPHAVARDVIAPIVGGVVGGIVGIVVLVRLCTGVCVAKLPLAIVKRSKGQIWYHHDPRG